MFSRLGSWCVRRRRIVVVLWLVVLIIGGSLMQVLGTDYSTDFGLPDVESRRGLDIIENRMAGSGSGLEGLIVFRSKDGLDSPRVKDKISAYLDKVAKIKDVVVVSPYDESASDPKSPFVQWLLSGVDDPSELLELSGDGGQVATAGDQSGRIGYATVSIPTDDGLDQAKVIGEKIINMKPDLPGLQIEFGGDVFMVFAAPASEMLGLAFAIVILILAFGSVLAMGLPIGVALAGIGAGSISLGLLSNVTTMPDFATTVGVMIGLGVGIDYALFIVTRYREQLRVGHTVEEAVEIAIDTSGRAVTFAGITVVISLLGMLIMNVSFVSGLGIGAAVIVTLTMIASLTLLPALLGFAGERVNVTRWRGLISTGLVAVALIGLGLKLRLLILGLPLALIVLVAGFVFAPLRKQVPQRAEKPLNETTAYRWSRFVQNRPWALAIGATLLLAILAIPLSAIRLGFSDEGNLPTDSSGRKAYDLISDGFGPGTNGKLLLIADVPKGLDVSTSRAMIDVSQKLAAIPGVQSVGPPIASDFENPSASKAVLWTVIPETSPQDETTTDLVRELRSEYLPDIGREAGVEILLTGKVGISVDFSDYLADRLVFFFGAVLALSFLLLMAVFRSLLVPLKAVIMNLLSIGAAYGVIVAIFQWGWAKDIFKVEPGPIEPFVPMMLFAIVFGLSMDYEVFLLSRIREEWVRTGDSRTSVVDGLASTARVITAAAAIMIFVFGSFLLEGERVIKLMGFGLALAVFLDATVVRMLLVPATMELLGDRNWWIPKWLNRILPNINVEGPSLDDDLTPGSTVESSDGKLPNEASDGGAAASGTPGEVDDHEKLGQR